ncbi:MAG TPA: hypothetical protein VI911_02435 [Patescibacteria group bacterium]|nr:hypothetical protein [Patescibacteria group bacterium]
MKHTFVKHEKCKITPCPICDGALALCSVCGGAESSLTTECCGEKMPSWLEAAVSNSCTDFIGGKWIITESGRKLIDKGLKLVKNV